MSPRRGEAVREDDHSSVAAPAALAHRSCPGSPRDEPGKEPTRLAARVPPPGLALVRPRQRKVDPRPRDPDVEEAALLLDRVLVVERLADR